VVHKRPLCSFVVCLAQYPAYPHVQCGPVVTASAGSGKEVAKRILQTLESSQTSESSAVRVNNLNLCSSVHSTVTAQKIQSTSGDDRNENLSFHDPSSDEETDGTLPTSDMDAVFKESYRNFLPTQKWRLPGGSTVEDTLYSTYWTEKSPRVRNLIVNWVVDLNDKTMEGMFTREDCEAISSWAVIF
jgi:hypothetical protein